MEPLIFGNYYHFYNPRINSCKLFDDINNYEYLLNLYNKYISLIADTFAWVLIPNYFHFLIKIKEDIVYKYLYADRLIDAVRF